MATKKEQPEYGEGFPDEQPDYVPPPEPGTEVTLLTRKVSLSTIDSTAEISVAELRELSFEQLAALLAPVQAGDVIDSGAYGNLTDDKDRFVKTPLIIVHYEFHEGDYGENQFTGRNEFVSLWIMTNAGERFIVNDGSTGIYVQLRNLYDTTKIDSMIVCKNGFRKSEYDIEVESKSGTTQTKKAVTYYLDLSA